MGKELKKQWLSRLQLCSNTQAMSESEFILYKPKTSSLVHSWNNMNGGMYQRHPPPCVMYLMQSAKQKVGPFTAASKRQTRWEWIWQAFVTGLSGFHMWNNLFSKTILCDKYHENMVQKSSVISQSSYSLSKNKQEQSGVRLLAHSETRYAKIACTQLKAGLFEENSLQGRPKRWHT